MTDYHFKHYTLSISDMSVRVYDWKTVRPMYPPPALLAVLIALVTAKNEVVSVKALISTGKGHRRGAALLGYLRPFRNFPGCVARLRTRGAVKNAVMRLRREFPGRAIETVPGKGYRFAWHVTGGK